MIFNNQHIFPDEAEDPTVMDAVTEEEDTLIFTTT